MGSTPFPISPASVPDFFDPNTWSVEPHICHIYGDRHAEIAAQVDYEDYIWATQWLWHHTRSRGRKGKLYICRNKTIRNGSGRGGNAETGRINICLFLHVAIMERTGIAPPSPAHTMVDHRDGNSLNCRRSNLRWATPSMNRKNINGAYTEEISLDNV